MTKFWVGLFACALAAEAGASCGTAFCMVNTNWNVQGVWTEPGLRLDLRFEYIDQDQPRAGSKRVGVGEIPQHHDEIRTINRNWLATLDYTFNEAWGVSATLPVIDRDHRDVRVLGRRQWRAESAEAQRLDFFGATFGLKLPTGRDDVRNPQGLLAERTLQPGTGTTDLLVGGYFHRVLSSGSSWFADVLIQAPFDEHENFKPGVRSSLNLLHRDRDSGSEAEPDNSGGRFVYASPGLSYVLLEKLQAYAFLQLPLYQLVNGVQLTADWAFVTGLSVRF